MHAISASLGRRRAGAAERVPIAIIDAAGLFYRRPSPGRSIRLVDIGRVPVMRDDAMVGARDLDPKKARVLLMLALSRTADPREVARIFQTQQ